MTTIINPEIDLDLDPLTLEAVLTAVLMREFPNMDSAMMEKVVERGDKVAALFADAQRYRWLRRDNAYRPEAAGVRGGEELDALCDAGIRERVDFKVSFMDGDAR